MFILAFIILPALIIGNLILIGVNLYRKKMRLIMAFVCIAIPIFTLYIHATTFPAERQEGFVVLVRYPDYVLVQALVNAILFISLKFANAYEKLPRRNYYRDHEENTKEEQRSKPSSHDLLDD